MTVTRRKENKTKEKNTINMTETSKNNSKQTIKTYIKVPQHLKNHQQLDR